ncbi:hypothetical protein GCM10011351_05250 [Paraliobacillus quinghaiensis]|uniref:Core domain-containing protein n=1 Tax=Paraliobacillus quinghaiensis TaxID=470815 RepID=A0A917TG75_9BACI|nr:iron-sulfur cluster biosynthesis family protein [Paraliobacillus quinghaiensis]GGM22311.1 hypothetical protein GCM10011351_05250 [Paraliobacillus quinghaiensis]
MKLTITDVALEKLQYLNHDDKKYIVLFYDTDDCGCGVNGLPTIRFTDTMKETDKTVESEAFDVIVDKQQAVFFAPDMKLDFTANAFRLSSPEGILNPIISDQAVQSGVPL